MGRVFSSEALARIRREHGWSQEELARRSGVATVTVAKLEERKSSDPRASTLARIADALGCTVEQLVSEDPTRD